MPPSILILGDVMLDQYVWGEVRRVSPEAPVPVVRVCTRTHGLGGAGNVAANLAGLKADAFLLGVCGDDSAGVRLRALIEANGIRGSLSVDPSRKTTTKTRVMAQGQQLMRLDEEDSIPVSPSLEDALLDAVREQLPGCGAVILSDYGKGILTSLGFVRQLIESARTSGVPVLVDPKGTDWERYRGAACITPNLSELQAVAQPFPAEDDAQVAGAAGKVLEKFGLDRILVTRGARGMCLLEKDSKPHFIRSAARQVFDVSGAGDTVIATLAHGIARGDSFEQSARRANLAAGIVVGKLGTQPILLPELEAAVQAEETGSVSPYPRKLASLEDARARILQWRSTGAVIVFTNGCFDLLHPGHIHLLKQARSLGDRLIIGLNSDESVRRLKGPARPILSEHDRAAVLGALEAVDLIVVFGEDTPLELISALRPDILVKGSDYTLDTVVGRDLVESYGGRVRLVPLLDGHSTTRLVRMVG